MAKASDGDGGGGSAFAHPLLCMGEANLSIVGTYSDANYSGQRSLPLRTSGLSGTGLPEELQLFRDLPSHFAQFAQQVLGTR